MDASQLPGRGMSTTLESPRAMRWLALGALVGPILFTMTWFILGFVSTGFTIYGVTIAPYSPLSAQISGLGLGVTAPYMNTVFVLTGLLILIGLFGIFNKNDETNTRSSWPSLILLALTPLGALMLGFFSINSGFIHYMISIVAFIAPVVSFVVAGMQLRKIPRWNRFSRWLMLGSPVTLILLILFFMTFIPTPQGQEVGVGGLVERVLVTEILFWYAAMGWNALRQGRDEA